MGNEETEVRPIIDANGVFSDADTPTKHSIDAMLAGHVHPLSLSMARGLLVGVINTFDILKNVKP